MLGSLKVQIQLTQWAFIMGGEAIVHKIVGSEVEQLGNTSISSKDECKPVEVEKKHSQRGYSPEIIMLYNIDSASDHILHSLALDERAVAE